MKIENSNNLHNISKSMYLSSDEINYGYVLEYVLYLYFIIFEINFKNMFRIVIN